MKRTRPQVVVFFGGDAGGHDASLSTGHWVCQYVPRETFDITPVRVLPDGRWQVPLGSLPQQGPIERMLQLLFSPTGAGTGLRAFSPAEGLQRLLRRPVHALMSVIRGRGGDDGALHGLGQSLQVPVVGSPASTCQVTYHKGLCSTQLKDNFSLPRSISFRADAPLASVLERIQQDFVPPLFIKPATQEGSLGTESVASLDELAAAVRRVQALGGDMLVQERARGTEVNVTLVENDRGKLVVLPPTLIVPRQATFYDRLAKMRPGRVSLHTPDARDNKLLREAETIARDVYQQLGCQGYASVDFIADDNSIDVLEVNTVPTYTAATPLGQQLTAGQLHPATLLDTLIRRALN